jgi:hypothetical protein
MSALRQRGKLTELLVRFPSVSVPPPVQRLQKFAMYFSPSIFASLNGARKARNACAAQNKRINKQKREQKI